MRAMLLLVLLAGPATAFSWGWDAHKLVCGLAEEQLSRKARDMVNQILNESESLKGGIVPFPEACLWPDKVKYSTRKDTYEHHFVNVPDDATTVVLERDCLATDCLANAVQEAVTYLSMPVDGTISRTRRAAALRYLGHYIGDLHQPLHVGHASDWGGNKITVSWRGKKKNLHAYWDYMMPESANLKYPQGMKHLSGIRPGNTSGTVYDWLNESLALARNHAYVDERGRRIRSGQELSEAYFQRNKPVVVERVLQAAQRLAGMLNRIADGKQQAVFRLVPVAPD